MPYGGWWAIPPVAGNGWMILGDSAGFLNSARLKGIHLAIKSGMLAAETAFEALKEDDSSAASLGEFQKKVESSWIKEELWKVRNLHQGFEHGMFAGMFHTALQIITGGRGLRNRYAATPGYMRMKRLSELPTDGGAEAHMLGPAKGDGKITFDKLTDLYHSGTKHEEDQPAHLVIHDTNVCNERCVKEYGSPCQNFCPANVYEMVDDSSQRAEGVLLYEGQRPPKTYPELGTVTGGGRIRRLPVRLYHRVRHHPCRPRPDRGLGVPAGIPGAWCQPGVERGKTGEVEAAFSGDVGVAVKRDVGNGVAPRCQEWFVGKLVLHHCQRAIPAVAFALRQCTL